ncbi:response regulator, partial [Methylobacterium sp.]|uniref:response regulator n=1 Tax=Methylobacterium sp. TaxID=409 RepID=UPI0025872FF8
GATMNQPSSVREGPHSVSRVLTADKQHGLEILFAENGRDGIELLRANPNIDAMLVDIMMPEMDGYETMREIRRDERFRALPLIAVTAKAMKGDREKCMEAGASDYVSKPVDLDQLLAVLRVQLEQRRHASGRVQRGGNGRADGPGRSS